MEVLDKQAGTAIKVDMKVAAKNVKNAKKYCTNSKHTKCIT